MAARVGRRTVTTHVSGVTSAPRSRVAVLERRRHPPLMRHGQLVMCVGRWRLRLHPPASGRGATHCEGCDQPPTPTPPRTCALPPPPVGRALTGPHEWSDASHVPRAVEGYTRPRPRPPRTGAAPPSMAGRAPDWSRAGRASSGRDRPSFAPHRRRPHPAGPRDDRAVALRVLLTFVQARMLLLCIQTLVPVKHVAGTLRGVVRSSSKVSALPSSEFNSCAGSGHVCATCGGQSAVRMRHEAK